MKSKLYCYGSSNLKNCSNSLFTATIKSVEYQATSLPMRPLDQGINQGINSFSKNIHCFV